MLILLYICSIVACIHDAHGFTFTPRPATAQTTLPTTDASADLATKASGLRRLRSATYGTYIRAFPGNTSLAMASGPPMLWERWYIDELNGKVTIKSFHAKAKFLTAYSNARVGLASKPKKWETWTPLKNDDGTWSFQSAHGGWLSASEQGSVRAEENPEAHGRFWLEFWTDSAPPASAEDGSTSLVRSGCYKIMSVLHGTYLRAQKDTPKVRMVQGAAEESEEWHIEESTSGKVFINAINTPNRFLRAVWNGAVDAVERSRKWEEWTPVRNADGSFSFLSVHGLWLSARADGSVKAVKKQASSEQFWLEPSAAETHTEPTTTEEPTEEPTEDTTEAPVTTLKPIDTRVLGEYCLKTCHHGYIRARKVYAEDRWILDVGQNCDLNSRWHIKERRRADGQVLLQANYPSHALMHSFNNEVSIEPSFDNAQEALWTPSYNGGGLWSFQNAAGFWLSAHSGDGSVTTMRDNLRCEQFKLETMEKRQNL